jgi:hypothetical protein
MKYIIMLLILTSSVSFAEGTEGYLSGEQNSELNRRSAIDALRDTFIDPELIREGRRLKEISDKAILEVLIPPSLQTVKDILITKNRREIDKVFVYPNQITTFMITDSMGEPWPLKSKPIVASSAYSVSYDPKAPGFFTLETSEKFIPSSLVLPLRGRLRPLQFQLFSDNQELNFMVDIVVQGRSPSNETSITLPFNGLPIQQNDAENISQFLDSPPEDAIRLMTVGDRRVSVWRWKGFYIIKSPYALLDPSSPADIQGRADSENKIYLVKKRFLVAAFLNQKNNEIINIEISGGYK